MLNVIGVLVMAAAMADPLVAVSLDLDKNLQKVPKLVPKFDGLTIVSSGSPDFTVHARLDNNGDNDPFVTMWVTPVMNEVNAVTVHCVDEPDCKKQPRSIDAIRALFAQALDLTLFSHARGIGYLKITACEVPYDCTAQLDVESSLTIKSSSQIGLDHVFYYVLFNYDPADSKRVSSPTHRELKLLPDGRESPTKGRFNAIGGSAMDTMQFFRKLCKKAGTKPPFALVMQVRSPDLRWLTLAPSAQTVQ